MLIDGGHIEIKVFFSNALLPRAANVNSELTLKNEDWNRLFLLIAFSCSLEELGPETDNVVLAFKQLAEEFGEKFRKRFDRDI